MPVELSQLLSNKRWVAVDINGETLSVAYRPGATSLKRQAQLQKRMRQLQQEENPDEEKVVDEAAQVFCEIVCDWDLTDGGHKLPVDAVTVGNLPSMIYNAIMDAINSDGQTDDAEKKALSANSAAGSPMAAKPVAAQNGIPQLEQRGTWA